MTLTPAELLLPVFRNYNEVFTARDLVKVVSSSGIKLTQKDIESSLQNNPFIFELGNGHYITKSAVFTGSYFSIKPTAFELQNNCLIVGHRCSPFLDPEFNPCEIYFLFNDIVLPKKVVKIDSDKAIDYFELFGEEYSPQYIASDPANEKLNIVENDFILPAEVYLTVYDITEIKEKYGFGISDRFLCQVENWDQGVVTLSILNDTLKDNIFNTGDTGQKRLEWFFNVEKCLLESFDKYGPLSSIDDQLARIVFDNKDSISVPWCGSFEEYYRNYKKEVSIEYFGVETRLWHKGQIIPAVGIWNQSEMAKIESNSQNNSSANPYYTLPDFVFDLYITDMIWSNKIDSVKLYDKIFPDEFIPSETEKKFILLHITERTAILQKNYNCFKDRPLGFLRHKMLDLFSNVSWLVYKIEVARCELKELPQQELVILSQLYNHLIKMLDTLAKDVEVTISQDEADSLLSSLEGMTMNFEDIVGSLENVINSKRFSGFKIV